MRASIVLVAFFIGFACATFSELQYQNAFVQWMHDFGRIYTTDEFFLRFENFKYNMDFVDAWNADATHTHTVELNQFADISLDEYKRIYLGTRIDATERLAREAGRLVHYTVPEGDNVNWAASGAVTPPKDQGQCGSCWAFSTTGSVEALNFIYTRNLISLSEQNLMDCSTGYGNNGCNGGWMDSAFKYIIANNGIDREDAYRYEAKNGPCRFNPSATGASIKGYSDVQAGSEGGLVNAINKQPVSIAIDAGHTSFQLYRSGIYYEPACSSSNLDHGVLAIGYGSENGDYFIVKNSWGTGWGMNGYLWMSRNRGNNCGVATAASVPLP